MITLFILQFIANFFWTFFFFSLQNNLLSVIDISLLWLLLIVQQWDYLRYKLITRGWLMIPYILWVTFAALLNYSILFLIRNIKTPEKNGNL